MNNEKIEKIEDIEEYFVCERCGFESDSYVFMKRHLDRKKKCLIKNEKIGIEEKELNEKSLIKKYKNLNTIINQYKELKEKNNNNDNNTNNENNNINNRCNYCFNNFSTKGSLDRHIPTCKIKSIIEENNVDNNNSPNANIIINNNNNTNNIQNNIQNINYNITLNLDKQSIDKMLIPFYDKFDTSHISDETQMDLLLSVFYEETLKEILKNNANFNFYLDQSKEENSLIYIDNKKVDKVNNEVIYTEIWKKIKDYLLESLNELKNKKKKYDNDVMKTIENKINVKHDYLHSKDKNTHVAVRNIMNNCFEENKDKIMDKLKSIDTNLIENI